MERVTGIGGVFFKSPDPKSLQKWYQDHLGVASDGDGYVAFKWVEEGGAPGMTVWSPFPQDTDYFEPSTSPFMVNFRVNNLDQMLEQLRAAGCEVDDKVEDGEFGKFGWVMDPDGTRIELWQPPAPGADAEDA